jgi:hypothetical protein
MNNLQRLGNEAPILIAREVHVIEDDLDEMDKSNVPSSNNSEQDHGLEDAILAWKEVSSLVRKIGRYIIKREVSLLKLSAQVITQRVEAAGISRHGDSESTSEPPCKRRRVSAASVGEQDFEERFRGEKYALKKRILRLKRVHAILGNVRQAHHLLDHEIREMIQDENSL